MFGSTKPDDDIQSTPPTGRDEDRRPAGTDGSSMQADHTEVSANKFASLEVRFI